MAFPFFGKSHPVIPVHLARDEKTKASLGAIVDYLNEIRPQLTQDRTRRLSGDGVYSGYSILRQFYKGQQWSHAKEGGGTMRTYNYIFTIVENMTAFLTNEPPQMSCPPTDVTDAVQRKLAEGRTKLLNSVHEDNKVGTTFQEAARIASRDGDTFIFGPIPRMKVDAEGNKRLDRIFYCAVENPENVLPIWKDDNFTEMEGFINSYRVSVAHVKRMFKDEIAKAGITVSADMGFVQTDGKPNPTELPMMTVSELWLENEWVLFFGADFSRPVDYIKHDWGFIPLQYIPNIRLPGEARGTSDIENELDPQQEYNERLSDVADIIREVSRPAYWGVNVDNMSEIRSGDGQTVIYSLPDDGRIEAMPKSGTTAPIENYLARIKTDIVGLSGLNEVLYPGQHVMQATGRALSVIMQGVNNKISLRKSWWENAFKDLNGKILYLLERYIPESKKVIDGNYKTDVFVSSVLLRSVTDEISKFQAKIQSLTTTQTNVGISSPSEEQKLMKEELQDEILSVEISKQPGLLHQVLADRMAAATQKNPQYAAQGGAMPGEPLPGMPPGMAGPGPKVQGQSPQVAPEGAGGKEGMPPTQGVAPKMSPQGAIKRNAAIHGGVNVAPKKK